MSIGWISILMGLGWLVGKAKDAPEGAAPVYMVIASAEWGFLGWRLQHLGDGKYVFDMKQGQLPVQWLHCTSLAEWSVWPYSTKFPSNGSSDFGALHFVVAGMPMPLLEYAVLLSGTILSPKQMKQLLEAHGHEALPPHKRENLANQLVKVLWPEDVVVQQQALDKLLGSTTTQAANLESRINPILESVVEEMDPLNATELSEEKEAIKVKRAKASKATAAARPAASTRPAADISTSSASTGGCPPNCNLLSLHAMK